MQQVTLAAVLEAKERLALLQAELRTTYNLPIVSITTNIPGSVKDTSASRQLLRSAADKLRTIAFEQGFTIAEERFLYPVTGPVAIMAVNGEANRLKLACIAIEQSGDYARLFDLDVFDAEGVQISRRSLGQMERTCFLCEQPAVLCRRLGNHDSRDILNNVRERLEAFAAETANPWPGVVWDIGSKAVEAMLMEAACTPAPGLVDRDNSGAHQDMDFFTFLISSSALTKAMFRCTAAGYYHQGTLPSLLPVLRNIGKDGERQMLQATCGVNTQKGLLFLLGILAASAAYCLKESPQVTAGDILKAAAVMTDGIVERELAPLALKPPAKATAGEKLYIAYGVTGIRGEIEAGMPSIGEYGLPALKKALERGLSLNDALVHTLINLMTTVEDTTILHRHNMDTLREVQTQAREIMEQGGMLTAAGRDRIIALDKAFIERNISPGGVADLLAATYFLYIIDTNHKS